MSRVMNVLILPPDTDLGMELHRSIRHSSRFCVFGRPFSDTPGPLPLPGADDFLPALTRVIRECRIDLIYPASDGALLELSELAADGLLEADVVAPGVDVCRACRSREAFQAILSGMPPVTPAAEPAEGEGADPGIAGGDFAVDCFTNAARELLFASGRELLAVENGRTLSCALRNDARFRALAAAVNDILPMRGAWSLLARADGEGRLTAVRARARLGAASGLQQALGVNLPLAALLDRLGEPVFLEPNSAIDASLDRRPVGCFRLKLHYDVAYLGLTGAVLRGDMVNPEAARFIFQCRNRGIRVVLLEKDRHSPERLLARHRLAGLFDQVIGVGDDEGKVSAVTHGHAVLIDDDEEERCAAVRLGIPAFDPSAFHMLTDCCAVSRRS